MPVYFGAGGYGDTFEDGRVFDLNQATPQVYYNLLWATREHSFDVSYPSLPKRLCRKGSGIVLLERN